MPDAPSVLEILRPALGPSSSHTYGPLRAATDFGDLVRTRYEGRGRVRVVLYGSLAHTGHGHLTDAAVAAGLAGYDIDALRSERLPTLYRALCQSEAVSIGNASFRPRHDTVFDTQTPPVHPNTLRFELRDDTDSLVWSHTYFSIGGGRIVGGRLGSGSRRKELQNPISMSRIIEACETSKQPLSQYVLDAEGSAYGHTAEVVTRHMGTVWEVMKESLAAGLDQSGPLPGGLGTERRAAALFERYRKRLKSCHEPSSDMTTASIYAIAIAEENADGGIIATAPTCGSAGVLPACLRMLQEKHGFTDNEIVHALLVAGIIGCAAVSRASIAGAVVGCQGEIGVASAMAAAAVCGLLGGSVRDQVDRAAETALEHFLGLACDPVGGLVQIPCIERNAAGAASALNAANLALLSGGRDRVSLDATLDAMREIGYDMSEKYRETGLGGLAVIRDLDGDGLPDAG